MANKFLLKKSSVAAKVPLATDLDYGELALNYADGKLYYKTATNSIDHIDSVSATATLTNKTLTTPTINGGALSGTFSGVLSLSDTTASTSTTTGAVKIAGGLGVAGTIYADQIRLTNNGNGTNVYIGDDVVLGDINAANTIGIRGIQDSTQGYIVFGSSNSTAYIGRNGTNPITVTGQFSVNSGTVTGGNAIAMQISGYANKGGTGYHDFLSVTNSYGSATNPNKFFRLNSSGNLEIINSAYTTNIFTLTDAGVLSVPQISAGGGTGTNGQVLQSTGTGMQWATIAGSGTVTNIATGTGLTGGPITTTGTISIDTTVVAQKTDTHYIGTTAVALNRASANLALTGILSVTLPGSTSGSVQIIPAAIAGTGTVLTLPATTGTVITSGDTGTVTDTMLAGSISASKLAGSIPNNKLTNSTISGVSLGSNLNTLTIGTGLSGTSYNGSSAVTIAIDSTVATLSGTQTLSNKSLNSFDQKTGSTSIANQSVWQSVITTTAQIAIDSFAAATYRSAKYVVQLTQGANYQVSEIMIIHNGTTTTMTEYGMMNTNGVLGTFATDISAGYVRLLVTMGSATSVTINMVRTTIVV